MSFRPSPPLPSVGRLASAAGAPAAFPMTWLRRGTATTRGLLTNVNECSFTDHSCHASYMRTGSRPYSTSFHATTVARGAVSPTRHVLQQQQQQHRGASVRRRDEQHGALTDGAAAHEASPYDMDAHIAEAESLLREVFGPQAKLVVHRLRQPQHRRHPRPQPSPQPAQEVNHGDGTATEADGNEGNEGGGGADLTTAPQASPRDASTEEEECYYKVSATFRLLGFPVELAVTKGRNPEATIENCLRQALSSDVEFIRPTSGGARGGHANRAHHHNRRRGNHLQDHSLKPHQLELKAIMEELKQLCVDFSRSLRFSIKPPRSAIGRASSTVPSGQQQQQQSPHLAGSEELEDGGDADDDANDDGPAHGSLGVQHSDAHLWRCRAYMKDEWSVVARMTLAGERQGATPNEALTRCLDAMRTQLKEERESPEVMFEAVQELEAFVCASGKSVQVSCHPEAKPSHPQRQALSGGGEGDGDSRQDAVAAALFMEPHTYRGVVEVRDAHGNTHVTTSRRQPNPLLAYQTAACQGIRNEVPFLALSNAFRWREPLLGHTPPHGERRGSGGGTDAAYGSAAPSPFRRTAVAPQPMMTSTDPRLPTVAPLLVRMRWQFEQMVQRLQARLPAAARDRHPVAEVVVGHIAGSHHHQAALGQQQGSGEDATGEAVGLPMFFTASFLYDGALVWQTTGAGRYRVEFDAYVQALYHLLEQHPTVATDVVATTRYASALGGGNALFATAHQLSAAVDRHDNYDIVGLHRGKWNCYALLGTLTSQLMGAYYQTSYYYVPPLTADGRGEWRSRLTVSDGYACSATPLIERGSLAKGEAWRLACQHALRENFPLPYEAAVKAHPDLDLSSDTMAKSSKYRALPREKRVEHIGNLFSLVGAFAEEDLGWHQLRIRLRNASGDLGLPQWVAELEALVEEDRLGADGEEGAGANRRRVVAVSAPYAQVKHAKRALVYQVAQRYFPKELAIYKTLDRGDALDPDTDPLAKRMRLYQPGGSAFTQQLCALIEAKNPSLAPVTWQLDAKPSRRHTHPARDDDKDEETWEGEELEDTLQEVLSGEGHGDHLVSILQNAQLFPEMQLEALGDHVIYEARVLSTGGDVLLAEHRGAHGEGALAVLTTALKAATHHLAGADGETLWTEFEMHAPPATTTTRELALYLFYAFLGGGSGGGNPQQFSSPNQTPLPQDSPAATAVEAITPATASSPPSDDDATLASGHAVAVSVAHLVNEFWFATVTVPRLGGLPIARAVSSTKKGSVKDALSLAARQNFARPLRYLSKHDTGTSALAKDILTEPVVEKLPDSVVRDVRRQLRATRRRNEALLRQQQQLLSRSPSAPGAGDAMEPLDFTGALPPMKLLLKCVRRDYPPPRRTSAGPVSRKETTLVDLAGDLVLAREKRLVVRQSQLDGGSVHECRLYLQSHTREVKKGDAQLVGFASAMSPTVAMNAAALVALENLFPEDLARMDALYGGQYRQHWKQ